MPRTCRLIVNPISGQGRGRPQIERVVGLLTNNGLQIELAPTTRRGDAQAAAREAALQRYDRVIVAAGDGTINEAVNALAGTETALGIIPFGTGNVAAINFEIPHDLESACAIAAADNLRAVDVGVANGLHFLLMAGIGFDAHVVHHVPAKLKKKLRDFAYLVKSVQHFFHWEAAEYTVRLDDGPPEQHRAWLAMVGNAAHYAWSIRITPRAEMNDGLLDFALFTGSSKLAHVKQVVSTLRGQHVGDKQIPYRQVRKLVIETTPPVPVQLDGDTVTCTPVTLTVRPRALMVVAP